MRAERFLESATEVFLEKGYARSRLSDVIARAGGSYATLYRAYGDKEGLAHAIMDRSIASFGEGLELLRQSELPPEQALPLAALRMLEEALSPRRIVAHRIVIGEGSSFPELRDWFFEHAVVPAEQLLTEYFEQQKQAGRLKIDSPRVAAHHFYMMVFGGVILQSVAGRVTAADIGHRRDEVLQAVAIFLQGVMPR